MNKLSNEAKIGLVVLASIIVAYLGFRVMKDEPFFSSSKTLYTKYASVDGLLKGGNVYLIGLKVGTVKELQYIPQEDSVLVLLNITEDISIPVGSKAKLVVPNFIGSSSIEIIKANNSRMIEWGSFIEGINERGLLDGLTEKGASMADSVSVSINKLNRVLSKAERLKEDDINDTIGSFKETARQVQELITRRQKK